MSQVVACLLWSLAGTNIGLETSRALSWPGIALFAFGGFWNTCNMALITKQYPCVIQGEVMGGLRYVSRLV